MSCTCTCTCTCIYIYIHIYIYMYTHPFMKSKDLVKKWLGLLDRLQDWTFVSAYADTLFCLRGVESGTDSSDSRLFRARCLFGLDFRVQVFHAL